MSHRSVVAAMLVVVAFALNAASAFSQGCGPCAPSVRGGMTGGTRTVYLDAAFTGDNRTDIVSAFGAVQWALSDLRGMVEFVFTDQAEGASVQIWKVPLASNVGGNTIGGGNGSGYVRLNTMYMGSNRQLVWNIATHEAMHTVGFFDQNNGGCGNSSQMVPVNVVGPFANGPTGSDVCAADQTWGGNESPIIISLNYLRPRISSLADGVLFDVRAAGVLDLVAWPTDDRQGFLALDRDGNGQIDSGAELFGNHTTLASGTVAANGYEALREHDLNADGWIDRRDPVFASLRLWIDRNRDGVSQIDELLPLLRVGIFALSLQYQTSTYEDPFGNQFRYRARVLSQPLGGARESWDVFLRNQRPF